MNDLSPSYEKRLLNADVDPYTYVLRHFLTAMRDAEPYFGKINDYEMNVLLEMKAVIARRDPASLEMRLNQKRGRRSYSPRKKEVG
jgi:hypothetical protein